MLMLLGVVLLKKKKGLWKWYINLLSEVLIIHAFETLIFSYNKFGGVDETRKQFFIWDERPKDGIFLALFFLI